MKRRACLHALALAGSALSISPVLARHHQQVATVGLQLYTVRQQMADDAAATLEAVAAAGYGEVETAGTGNLGALEFAQALSNAGLTAPAAHLPLNMIDEQPDEVLAMAQMIGYRYIVIPWLPPEMRDETGYAQAIATLNRFGERSAAEGVQTCYHNHDFEFKSINGTKPFDRMLTDCDRHLVQFELDLFWAAHAGIDAKAYLSADPSRYPLCHIKDRTSEGEMADVGAGTIDFPMLFAAGTGLQHYFVEHDRPRDPMTSIRTSIQAVKDMRF